ncbi:hypothetical protein ACFWVC_07565 [Streptomyces sp. NPDC058691]|uniref:hypothetical protein n=1 Tax=Streptomyces sp. NPDC058691 TaxID=3346601 RepID=UPI0036515CFC
MPVCGECKHPVHAAQADTGPGDAALTRLDCHDSCGTCRFETVQTAPTHARVVLITPHGVSTVEFAVVPSVSLRCTADEGTAALALGSWLSTTDHARYDELEIALLQFAYNPGQESFAADEILALRTFLAEQQGTARWNDSLTTLLARLKATEATLRHTADRTPD